MSTEPNAAHRPRVTTAALTAAARLGSASLGLAASIAISRALQPEGRGVYAVAAALAGVAAVVGSLAVHRALQFEYRPEQGPGALRTAALWAGGVGGVAGAALVGGIVMLWPAARGPAGIGIVLLGLAGTPAVVMWAHLSALMVLAERPATAARIGLWTTAMQSSILVGLALSHHLTPAHVIATGMGTAALGVPLALRKLPGATSAWERLWPRTRTLLGRGFRYQPGHLAQHLLLRVDLLILAGVQDARSAGLYSLAVALTEPIAIVTSSIAQAGAGLQIREEGGDPYTARLARSSLAVAALLAGAIALVAHTLIPPLFGEAFRPSFVPLLLLLPGTLALAAREPLEVAISRRDLPRTSSSLALGALGLNLLLNSILIPPLGPAGAAIASSAAYITQYVLTWRWFSKVSGLGFRSLIPRLADISDPARAMKAALQARRQ